MTMDQCEICSARVHELRRGRCWGCYSRWVESRPVGLGATCRMCGERRREYLRSLELLGAWAPVCHSCAGRIAAIDGLPQSLAGIRALLSRERRSEARRIGRSDGRVFPYDRRDLERRAGDPTRPDAIDDDMIVEIAELAHDLEILAAELPGERAGELTRIHASDAPRTG